MVGCVNVVLLELVVEDLVNFSLFVDVTIAEVCFVLRVVNNLAVVSCELCEEDDILGVLKLLEVDVTEAIIDETKKDDDEDADDDDDADADDDSDKSDD